MERLSRSVKHKEVYLDAYTSVPGARVGIGRYLGFQNAVGPHPALVFASSLRRSKRSRSEDRQAVDAMDLLGVDGNRLVSLRLLLCAGGAGLDGLHRAGDPGSRAV